MATPKTTSVQLTDANSSYAGKPANAESAVETVSARYERQKTFRDAVTLRAEQAARLTIPALFPQEGTTEDTQFPTPWSSVGAEGVQTLGAKLLLALFPVGIPMARRVPTLKVITEMRKKLGGPSGESQELTDARTAIDKALAIQEQEMMDTLEEAGFRSAMAAGLEQGIVAGNFLVQMLDDFTIVIHTLRDYVVCRDLAGNVIEVILKQTVDRKALTEELRAVFDAHNTSEAPKTDDKHSVCIYTWMKLQEGGKKYEVCQYVEDWKVEATEGYYVKEECPLFPVALNRIPGQNYGRGHVERYLGDLMSHDGLSESLVSGTAAIARFVTLVRPGGLTSKKNVQDAKNGAVIEGREEDVKTLQSQKTIDLQVAGAVIDKIERRLAKAFMDTTSIQRDAERVTAEEIRSLAQAIDTNFGGMYSLYVTELQRPMACRTFALMEKKDMLAPLPDDAVKVQIVGGLAALGRTSDYEKLMRLVSDASKALSPETVAEYVNIGDFLQRGATGIGVDSNGLFKSAAQVQGQQQQQQQAELDKATAPQVVKGVADLRKTQAQAQQNAPTE